jgi:hypothetical protein
VYKLISIWLCAFVANIIRQTNGFGCVTPGNTAVSVSNNRRTVKLRGQADKPLLFLSLLSFTVSTQHAGRGSNVSRLYSGRSWMESILTELSGDFPKYLEVNTDVSLMGAKPLPATSLPVHYSLLLYYKLYVTILLYII